MNGEPVDIEVATKLWRLCVARLLPPVRIDAGRIQILDAAGIWRRISWGQARRLTDGESLADVLAHRRAPTAVCPRAPVARLVKRARACPA
jgi:hypothetical protein